MEGSRTPTARWTTHMHKPWKKADFFDVEQLTVQMRQVRTIDELGTCLIHPAIASINRAEAAFVICAGVCSGQHACCAGVCAGVLVVSSPFWPCSPFLIFV